MTNETHFVGKVAQKAIIEKDGKVLISRDVRDVDIWELPGGRLNENEDPKEGLKRELFEELGVGIEILGMVHVEHFMHPHKNEPSLLLAYHATLVDPLQDFIFQPEEVAEAKWITREDLENISIYPMHRRALEIFFEKR